MSIFVRMKYPVVEITPGLAIVIAAAGQIWSSLNKLLDDLNHPGAPGIHVRWVEIKQAVDRVARRASDDNEIDDEWRVTCDASTNPPNLDRGAVRFRVMVKPRGIAFLWEDTFIVRRVKNIMVEIEVEGAQDVDIVSAVGALS